MIGYVTLGTNDLAKAAAFYDALLVELGAARTMELDRGIVWAAADGGAALGVMRPFDGADACIGNGVMVALEAPTNEAVDRVHKKALELGATDEGAPGPRGMDGFYAAYFRDLDGNKLNVFHFGV